MGWPSRELGDTPDLNSSKGAEPQEVGVAADDHLGFYSDGAFQNAVVSGVSFDHVDPFGRLDEPGDDTQLPVGFGNPLGRAVELVSEDAKGLRDDGFGDGKVDLNVGGDVEKLFRVASELQCADK